MTTKEAKVRKALLFLGLVLALAAPAAATASKAPITGVICANCDGGLGGWTGCTQVADSHSASIPLIASINHYLVVSYCKQNGWITSVSIAAHGCDTGGLVSCSLGAAWQTSGGVGYGYATFEAHASWIVTTSPWYTNSDTLNISIPLG
jgi:hypothetical protein